MEPTENYGCGMILKNLEVDENTFEFLSKIGKSDNFDTVMLRMPERILCSGTITESKHAKDSEIRS